MAEDTKIVSNPTVQKEESATMYTCVHRRESDKRISNLCQRKNGCESHQHSKWRYEMTAWDTIQTIGHSGEGGTCLGMRMGWTWQDVVAFYDKFRNANYCSISAFRTINETLASGGYSLRSQYITVYLRCVGCKCTEDIMADWVQLGELTDECLDLNGKPKHKL
jgi:hypothetical protein